jgi:hypothetical protein
MKELGWPRLFREEDPYKTAETTNLTAQPLADWRAEQMFPQRGGLRWRNRPSRSQKNFEVMVSLTA